MVAAELIDTLPAADVFSSPNLLYLPDHLLKRILHESDAGASLRFVCKAFAIAVAKTTTKVILSRKTIRDHALLRRVFTTFPDASRVTLDFNGGLQDNVYSITEAADDDDAALVDGALDALAALRHPLTSLTILHLSRPLPLPSTATLDYLASCGLSELQLQDVSIQRSASDGASNLLRSHSPPSPSLPGQLPGSSLADSIRARGAAMVRFACCLPTLQRLSLCNAAFSSGDVAALAALTQLQELSLDGAMECSPCSQLAANSPLQNLFPEAPAASAGPAFKTVLASLPRLRRLQLPMAIPAPLPPSVQVSASRFDNDDDDGADNGFMVDDWDSGSADADAEPLPSSSSDRSDFWDTRSSASSGSGSRNSAAWGPCNSTWATSWLHAPLGAAIGGGGGDDAARFGATKESRERQVGRCSAAGGWVFPPLLEELTIPLCSLNGPVFRAACEAYGHGSNSYGSGSGSYWTDGDRSGGNGASAGVWTARCDGTSSGGGLRAMHITCAPGYTVWDGSFLKADRDFAALSLLGSSLECLHLSLELGGSGRGALLRDRLRTCLRHLRPLARLKVLHLTETRQPFCFAARKSSTGQLDLLSALLGDACEPPRPCLLVPLPRLSLGQRQGEPEPSQPPLQPLPILPRNNDPLRRRVASLPPSRLASFMLSAAPSPPIAPASAASSAPSWPPSLDCLLVPWPHLETLVVCGRHAVRSGRGCHTRLVLLESLEQMMEVQGQAGTGKA
ncbi:hypothetical protein PLESTB_000119800 [Pleodorina starrii]|uniref:F-box domain-containing protein n=1 Tax=Pleodorina starrii TaxID=330485 RepID=A0A9W6BAQ9_9CHLO|nr:hypothetical protein PLESTB_000119800 [Pleodorina starrii]GLC76359.1 hypothetical protein PLESTF_001771000 [Pleodorina starrii]